MGEAGSRTSSRERCRVAQLAPVRAVRYSALGRAGSADTSICGGVFRTQVARGHVIASSLGGRITGLVHVWMLFGDESCWGSSRCHEPAAPTFVARDGRARRKGRMPRAPTALC